MNTIKPVKFEIVTTSSVFRPFNILATMSDGSSTYFDGLGIKTERGARARLSYWANRYSFKKSATGSEAA